MPQMLLRGEKNRNQCRTLDRIVADDRVEFCKKLIGNHEMEQALRVEKRVAAGSRVNSRVRGCRIQ